MECTIVCLFHVAKVFFLSFPLCRFESVANCSSLAGTYLLTTCSFGCVQGGKDGTPLEASGDGTRFCTLQILINVLPLLLLLLLLSDSVDSIHVAHMHTYLTIGLHYLPCTDPAVMVTLLRGLSAMHPQSHQVLQPLACCMSWTFVCPRRTCW